MTVYSNPIDADILSQLSELKRIRRGYRATTIPWYYKCNVGNWDCLMGFPLNIAQVSLVKVSAKRYKSEALKTLTINQTEQLDSSLLRVVIPLSDQGQYALNATSLRYGRVYVLSDVETTTLTVKRPSNKDYYLLCIDCEKE